MGLLVYSLPCFWIVSLGNHRFCQGVKANRGCFVPTSYFILPLLAHTTVKALFVAFSQGNGTVQAVALIIIEAAALITTGKLHPACAFALDGPI